jgi:iron complex transport system substrate-binding protein
MRAVSKVLLLGLMWGFALAQPNLAAAAQAEERYLVIGSYLAEIIVALGATDQVVGVSGGTDHVPELAGVPVIPGFRNLSAESMLSLSPTVALLAGRQTRPEIITQLEAAGVVVHFFSDDLATLDVVKERVREVGALLDREQEAEALVARFESDLEDALAFVAQATSRPGGLFILSGGGRPTVVAGADTHIALLIELAGARNLTTDISDYKPMSQEAMLAAAPDFILVNTEGLEQRGDVPVALSAPGATLTPAAANGRVFAIPNGFLQGLGLNSPSAIREIAKRIHPELAQ